MIAIPNYQVLELIHSSSNSLFYRGRRLENRVPVTIKVHRNPYPGPIETARHRREFEIGREFAESPHVVRYLFAEKYENDLAIVMEDFGAKSLADLIPEGGMEIGEFTSVAVALASAVAVVHRRGFIHKNIKPRSVAMNPGTREVKLLDFSLCSRLSVENIIHGADCPIEGTPAYISPEQTGRMNRTVDYRADFYSLGVVFYELLTGRLPYEASDLLELVHSHIAREPRSPSEWRPAIPEGLSSLVMKLLSIAPEDRYQTAQGLLSDLKECAREYTASGRVPKFALGARDVSERFIVPRKLYGRAVDVRRLNRALDHSSTGRCSLVLVSGYSGIGKSSLIRELQKPLAGRRGYFVSGKYEQFKQTAPFVGVIQAFADLFRQLVMESDSRLADWKARLIQALGPNGRVLAEVVPEVEFIIGPQAPVPALAPVEAENRFNLVIQNVLRVFCAPEHPLCIFLDDLQWADGASLRWLFQRLSDSNPLCLTLVGAFRDNETGPAHPLTITLHDIARCGAPVSHILLKPLELEHISGLIGETLRRTPAEVHGLAELVTERTGGNPFFVVQFLNSLHAERLLEFDPGALQWTWNLDRIRAKSFTDNVVELVAGGIQKLPERTREALKFAACIGSPFDLGTLATVLETTPAQAARDLYDAVKASLLSPLSADYSYFVENPPVEVRPPGGSPNPEKGIRLVFLHDRIQQAAYSLIPDHRRKETHLKIGRLLFEKIPAASRRERVFDLLAQLNGAVDLMVDPAERLEVIALNRLAARRARDSTAYGAAVGYLQTALKLLHTEAWRTHYDLALGLHFEAGEAAYLNTDFDLAERMISAALKSARTDLDTAGVLEVRMRSAMAQNRMREAVDIAREVAALLGEPLPGKPGKLNLVADLVRTKMALRGLDMPHLRDLPEMTDPRKVMVMKILVSAASAAFYSAPEWLPFMIFRMVRLSLRHGNCAISAYAYAAYGFSLAGVLGEIEKGYDFGRLSLQLVERFHADELSAKVQFVFHCFISHWKNPLSDSCAPLLEACKKGLEAGDLEYAAFSLHVQCYHRLYSGQDLVSLQDEVGRTVKAVQDLKQSRSIHEAAVILQMVDNLRRLDEPFSGEFFDERTTVPILIESNSRTTLARLSGFKCMWHFLAGRFEQAHRSAVEGDSYAEGLTGLSDLPVFCLFRALTLIAVARASTPAGSTGGVRAVRGLQQKLRKWTRHAPADNQYRLDLVSAEVASLAGRDAEAMALYDRAIDGASKRGIQQDAALANELAARHYLAAGRGKAARAYMRDAVYGYAQWGSPGKVRRLEAEMPNLDVTGMPAQGLPGLEHLGSDRNSVGLQPVTSAKARKSGADETLNEGVESLDIATVVRSCEAVASEIQIDGLVRAFMAIILQNAGAQRSVLLLSRAQDLVVQAETDVTEPGVRLVAGTLLEDYPSLPRTVIRSVARTRETVLMEDALTSSRFAQDDYIRSRKVRSVLCFPLVNQGKLTAILYLEHRSAPGVFTAERIALLQLLSGQIAISIDKAIIYQNLEEKVTERTLELHEKNEALVRLNQEKNEFMGVAAHDLKNPLSAIKGMAEEIQESFAELTEAEILDYARIIHKSSKSMFELVTTLLDVNAIESGKMNLKPAMVDLAEVTEALHKSYTPRGAEKDIRLSLQIRARPCRAFVDENSARQILDNLISNAVKYSPQGREIFIRLEETADAVRFEVQDQGPGLSAEDRKKLFGRFARLSAQPTGNEHSTGLGLFNVKKLIEAMKGRVWCESEPGKGATFLAEFPLNPSGG